MNLSEDANVLWQTAKQLARQAQAVSRGAQPLPPLLFFTDPDRTPRPWETARAMPAGAAVVFRAFSAPDALSSGRKLRAACDAAGVLLLVGRDEGLAADIGADGLHLPERDLIRAAAVRADHPSFLITGAVHTPESFDLAEGLDAAVVSPVFAAGGTSGAKTPLGVETFLRWSQRLPCPAYALGGIKASNVAELLGTHACGIAGVDAFASAFAG